MGVPEIYYIRALQYFAHALAYNDSVKKAKELQAETSEDILKQFIFQKKTELSDKNFYYLAGRATQCVIDETYEEGTDAFNASACGIWLFEEVIGIEESEDETDN